MLTDYKVILSLQPPFTTQKGPGRADIRVTTMRVITHEPRLDPF